MDRLVCLSESRPRPLDAGLVIDGIWATHNCCEVELAFREGLTLSADTSSFSSDVASLALEPESESRLPEDRFGWQTVQRNEIGYTIAYGSTSLIPTI